MEYRTIEGVELVTVGMEWPASTGPVTFTFEHLADAAAAANDDPHVVVPRLKLGHESEINGELNVIDPFAAIGDAAPAFGKVTNLRLSNDGAVLLGDYAEMPDWLADAAPSAFPNRSIEAQFDVTTEGGKHYTMVLTGVALLGAYLPAVTDLDDLERLMIEGPDLEATAATQSPKEGRMSESTAASISAGTIRERFNFEWTLDNEVEQDTYWWWCRDVRVEPNEVIADDDEGGIWSVSYETDGKDIVTFGEPVRVREDFVPVNASAGAVLARFRQRTDQQVLASNLERPEKPAPGTTAASQPDNEENDMPEIDLEKLRARLGLPDDATEEQINAALAEDETPVEESPEGDEKPEETPADEEDDEGVEARGVTLDEDAHAELKADAKAGREARQTQLKAERDKIVDDAVGAGKFPPSAKAAYRDQLERGGEIETKTREFISKLAKDTVPVGKERGEVDSEVSASAGLPGAWFPEINDGATGTEED